MSASAELLAIADRSFQRGQLEHALWRWFSGAGTSATPPGVFRSRIRKLLDVDRADAVPAGAKGVTAARFAFYDARPQGQGHEVQFTVFNAFCLALGIDLTDLGFKQAEVVFLLRYIRAELQREFMGILNDPPALHGEKESDKRLFMSFSKVELVEQLGAGAPNDWPVFLTPQFARGAAAAESFLDQLNYARRKTIVVELGGTAVLVCRHLADAPAVPRGRPRLKK